ncbi:imidazole glycerol phosphate synthase subunit HisH [Roseibacterium sp. SDUM158016]|uniref:imidazole glycerol phosphate synthase subunit HisH n=1 Tax=Roseicyclus sediminis TaxID=2980997 RepID=UPI0021D3BCAD|nr:imidazole glycerol phosphate synthase subunit HisH [Roseibacterium sp. SDUM158016]MCU4654164.1 imidazole glycerol phosphate synthase subunit HisH [Roseibacterium sp. SDUM158016]
MTGQTCVVVDYGSGNVYSVLHALKRIGVDAYLTSSHTAIAGASRVILPGVGAFGDVMTKLRETGLDEAVVRHIEAERPFLGICVGMQVLMETGKEFGDHAGLGVVPGTVERVPEAVPGLPPMRVPIIGWHPVQPSEGSDWADTPFPQEARTPFYYFVHSYSVRPADPGHLCGEIAVEGRAIAAALRKDNVFGVQFHPERSAGEGQRFLQRFMAF